MARLTGLLVLCVIAGPGPTGSTTGPSDAVSLGLACAFNEAANAFGRASRAEPSDRASRLGLAASLINAQPRTSARVEQAQALLAALVAADPRDEIGVCARYLAARILHEHRSPADLSGARKAYREMLKDAPSHPLAQAGAVKLALLELHAPDAATAAARLAAGEALLSAVAHPAMRSDLHVALGRSALHFRLPAEEALRHFDAARRIGFAVRAVQADTLVALVDLALEAGDAALARECAAEFGREFPRDSRRSWLLQRIDAIAR